MIELSVWATMLSGWTAMPGSMAHQKLWTRITPRERSTETSATPAIIVFE